MNLRQIEVFHAVYVCGSVTSAARHLNVSQPSLSKSLRHVEDAFKVALFRRLKGRLVPTDEAHSLFREVDDVYKRIGSLKRIVKNLCPGAANHLRLAVLPSLGLALAPEAISKFRGQNADVTFDVQTLDHADMFRCLYERESDIAVGFTAASHPRLRSVQIGAGEMVLLRRRGAHTRAGARLDIRELRGAHYIGLKESGPLGTLLAAELARLEVNMKEVASVRTFFVAAALVQHAVGVTIVDQFTAQAMMTHQLAWCRLSPPITFGVHCLWLEEKPPSQIGQQLIDIFSSLLSRG